MITSLFLVRSSVDPLPSGASGACGPTVLEALSQVTQRVYDEGVSSERTEIAMRLIKGSHALREAVEHGDAAAARSAAQALLASGHLTNLTVIRDSQTLANDGSSGTAVNGRLFRIVATLSVSVVGVLSFIVGVETVAGLG